MGKSYTEIKDSTLEWCKKLQKKGIYTEKDYQDCENSFRDLSLGEIPQDMKEGKDRIENSFSKRSKIIFLRPTYASILC